VVIFVVLFVIIGTDVLLPAMQGRQVDPSVIFSTKNLLAILICAAIMLPVIAATYLAPALIGLHDHPALTAMHMSLVGTFNNVLSGFVFGLCWIGWFIVALIPLGLGLLVLIPLGVIVNYTVYRDIFVEER